MKKTEVIKCPFCKHTLEIDVEFAKKNKRVFCTTCCKSFEIHIEDDEAETEEQLTNNAKGYYDWDDDF